jgi:hypothetical protein
VLGFSLGVTLGGLLFPPSLGAQERGRLDDLKVTGAGYGVMIPQVYGKFQTAGNLIWAAMDENGNALVEHVTDTSEGGKGGGGGATVRTYSYTVTMAMAFAKGPISELLRITAEDIVIYDSTASPVTQYGIDVYLGDDTQVPNSTIEAYEGFGGAPAYRGLAYVVFTDFPLTQWGERIPQMVFEFTTGTVTVGDILGGLFSQAGLTSSDWDLAEATDDVDGYILAQRTSVSAAVDELLRVFQTDLSEVDGVIRAVKRGGAIEATFDDDLLACRDFGSDPVTRMELVRTQDLDLPGRLDLTYFDPTANYNQAVEGSIRQTKGFVQEAETINAPLAMASDDARHAAETIIYSEWLGRTTQNVMAPMHYLKLAPGSPVLLTIDGTPTRCRVVSCGISLPGAIAFGAVLDKETVLTQVADPGDPAATAGATDSTSPVPSDFDAWSGTELRDQDGVHPGFYVVATGPSGWRGGTIYYSPDGVDWVRGGAITARSNFGTTYSSLAAHASTTDWDMTSTVSVNLVAPGELSTTSQTAVDGGDNAGLVGTEVIGFATATLNAPQDYTLSVLRRGRRGTSMAGQTSGVRFVELTDAAVRVSVPDSLIGDTIQVKVVSPGQTLADVTAVMVTIVAPTSPYATPDDLDTVAAQACGEPVTNGNISSPEMVFAGGDIVMVGACS